MPSISIIVPVYQEEKTIGMCIDSILAQTFQDFELLLIDDGSIDGSSEICMEYANRDCRIKVLRQQNAGVSAARNKGIGASSGEYIMFCDSDDYVDPHWCEYLYGTIKKYPDSFCTCDVQRVQYDSQEMCLQSHLNIASGIKTYYDVWKQGMSAYVVTKIYEKQKLLKSNIRFDIKRKFAEDVEFNVKYFGECDRSVVLENKLYYYRANPNSLMGHHYDDFFPVYSLPFSVRLPLISDEELSSYCDFWFADFVKMLEYVFLQERRSLLNKFRYNQKILKSEEFRIILKNMSGCGENPVVVKILKTKNYYLYWIFMKLVGLKEKIKN